MIAPPTAMGSRRDGGPATTAGSDLVDLSKRTGAKVFGPAGLIQTLIDLGWTRPSRACASARAARCSPSGRRITITQVRAEHSSELTVVDPATKKTTTHVGGEPAGFIIQLENGFKIYHMGDTGLFGDMKLIADYYKPDLVLMPIGGHFVMDPQDAAYATKELLKPEFVIPIHYGTFPGAEGHAAGVHRRARGRRRRRCSRSIRGQARVLAGYGKKQVKGTQLRASTHQRTPAGRFEGGFFGCGRPLLEAGEQWWRVTPDTPPSS